MRPPLFPNDRPLKPGWVSSAFLLLGGAFFVFFCAGLIATPARYIAPTRDVAMSAILHAAILGWLLSAGYGAVYLLLPALGAARGGDSLAGKAHFVLHAVALCWMLPAFARWDLAGVAHAGALMLAGFVICAALCMGSLEKGPRLPMVQITLVSSMVWLLLTLVLGILAAANYYWAFLPMSTLRAVHAAMHAGFGGYVVLLLIGLSYPLFQVETQGSMERRLWIFLLCNSGLYLSVLGIAFGLPLLTPAVLLVLSGMVLYLMEAMAGLPLRAKPAGAWVWGLFAGFLSILLLMGVGLALGLAATRAPVITGRLENLYGFWWIALATGLPLWAAIGRMLNPGAGMRRKVWRFLLIYLVAVAVGGWGILAGDARGVRAGGLLLLFGGAGLLHAFLPGLAAFLFRRGSSDETPALSAEEALPAAGGFPRSAFVWALAAAVVAWVTAGFLPDADARRFRAEVADRSVAMSGDGPSCWIRPALGFKDDSLARGRNLYGEHCAACHGTTGAGDGSAAIYLYPKPRNFTAGQFKLRSTASGMPTDEDLYGVLTTGMPGSSMPAFSHLSEQSRRDLVGYVKRLSQAEEDGRMVNWFKETPPGSSLPTPHKPEFTPELAAAGKRVYQAQDCKRCHGPEGLGDGPEAGTLKDAWGGVLRPRSLARDPFLGGDSAEAIFLRTATGIGGTPMTAYPDSKISPADRWALAAYIRSLREQAGTLGESAASASAAPVARRVQGSLPSSPSDPAWNAMAGAVITIGPIWRTSDPTRQVTLRAAHDGQDLAVLLEWANPAPAAGGGRVQDFVDRAALQFSLHAKPGFLGMGDPFRPVNLWQWSSRRRVEGEDPKALMTAVYPLKKAEVYPEHRDLVYSAMMAGNLVATETANAVEDANAQGPGTLVLQSKSDQNVSGDSAWANGKWRVFFRRRLAPQGRADVDLAPGRRVPMALAVWDGRNRDRNGQKNVSGWHYLTIEP